MGRLHDVHCCCLATKPNLPVWHRQAHNGSGKTTCFVLAMLSRVDQKLAQPQALCVCPTRELVVQNLQVLERMGKMAHITSTSTAATDFVVTR